MPSLTENFTCHHWIFSNLYVEIDRLAIELKNRFFVDKLFNDYTYTVVQSYNIISAMARPLLNIGLPVKLQVPRLEAACIHPYTHTEFKVNPITGREWNSTCKFWKQFTYISRIVDTNPVNYVRVVRKLPVKLHLRFLYLLGDGKFHE